MNRFLFLFLLVFLWAGDSHGRNGTGPSTVPVPQEGMEARHAEKVERAKAHGFGLLLVGDSITHNLERPGFRSVWDKFFAPRDALCLGYSGARTENILWNLSNGELEGQSPKVAVVLIGTNNSDDANYPVAHSAEEIAAGTGAIVALLRERLPQTKVLLLRVFPRRNEYRDADGVERGSAERRFAVNLRAGELVSKLTDGEDVVFLDLNHVFVKADGGLDEGLMPDLLHPSPEGAEKWAEAMEPTLAKLFGDECLVEPSSNSALRPVSKIEQDFYDWWARHEAILNIKEELNPEIVLIGDSITHLWGGRPEWPEGKGNGPENFARTFAGRRVLNLGYGYDRLQNVLWRLDHGEIDGLHPKVIVLNIGTNNLWPSSKAPGNTDAEIVGGIRAVVIRLRAKCPGARLVLMGLFPRGETASDRSRARIVSINKMLGEFSEANGIAFLDLGARFVTPAGVIPRELMGDFLHPTEKGYAIWGEALAPYLK
jgi:lysophospholipase L1-like esterase